MVFDIRSFLLGFLPVSFRGLPKGFCYELSHLQIAPMDRGSSDGMWLRGNPAMSKELWEIVPVDIAVRGESLLGTTGFIRKNSLLLRW